MDSNKLFIKKPNSSKELEISILLTHKDLRLYFVQCCYYDDRQMALEKMESDCSLITNNNNFICCLVRNVNKLHSLGIVHYDLKPENMIKKKRIMFWQILG